MYYVWLLLQYKLCKINNNIFNYVLLSVKLEVTSFSVDSNNNNYSNTVGCYWCIYSLLATEQMMEHSYT